MLKIKQKHLSIGVTLGVLLVLTSAGVIVYFENKTADASLANRGYIIDDSVMLNSASMSSIDIQTFLNQHGPICTVGTCLRNFTENGKSSATIFASASQTYGINPQVLISLVEAQSMLVTDSSPSINQFKQASGHSCASTDTSCQTFEGQITYAAQKLSDMTRNPSSSSLKYYVGPNTIPYSSNPACQSASVTIGTQATASIYSYDNLGYTPNTAALQSTGAGDSCSTYGIRNFYQNFEKWFYAPTSYDTSSPPPIYTYRFGNMPNNTHFWTKDAYEKDSMIRDGYRYEGTGWRVSPDPTPFPVYRLYHPGIRQHLFTRDAWEVHALTTSAEWRHEGIAWYATTVGEPVYRLYSPLNNEHFFTTDAYERSVLIGNGTFRDEGIGWSQP